MLGKHPHYNLILAGCRRICVTCAEASETPPPLDNSAFEHGGDKRGKHSIALNKVNKIYKDPFLLRSELMSPEGEKIKFSPKKQIYPQLIDNMPKANLVRRN